MTCHLQIQVVWQSDPPIILLLMEPCMKKLGWRKKNQTVPLGESYLRVAIIFVEVHDALLPIPISDEMIYVGDAIECHMAWKTSSYCW